MLEGDTITVDLQASGVTAAKSISWRYSVSGDAANTDDIEIREYTNTATALTAIPASRNGGSASGRAGADFTTTATRHQLFITLKTDTVADLGESFVLTFNNLSATGGGGVVPTPYSVKVSTVAGIDYDVDDDGLIDIDTLAKLDAIRYDPDGNDSPTTAGAGAYNAAFPGAVDDMGCPAYSDDGGSPPAVPGAGVRLSRTTLRLTEGAAASVSYNVRLNADPGGAASVFAYTPLTVGGVTMSADNSTFVVSTVGLTLNFTGGSSGNWNTDQTVYVKMMADSDSDARNAEVLHEYAGRIAREARLWLRGVESVNDCDGYELTADLDFDTNDDGSVTSADGALAWGGGAGWSPIGATGGSYAAVFRGHGHTIANLFINSAGVANVGLFGRLVDNARVSGVGLPDASVTAATARRVASLVGYTDLSTLVTDCWASGSVTATRFASQYRFTGGLIGVNSGRVGASFAGVSVTVADADAAGFACAGGLIGNLGGPLTASYSTGAVAAGANSRPGALVGWGLDQTTASYATGAVSYGSGGSTLGLYGLIGSAPAVASYWDYQTTNVADDADATAPEGKSTARLQAPTGYAGIYANWNANLDGETGNDDPWHFDTIHNYPILKYDGAIAYPQRDYDRDGDNLIEVASLARLNAMRYDPDGNGAPAVANAAAYTLAYPAADANMGCAGRCAGYELTSDLDFDENGDDQMTAAGDPTYWNGGMGWAQIAASSASPFRATLRGNRHQIATCTSGAAPAPATTACWARWAPAAGWKAWR